MKFINKKIILVVIILMIGIIFLGISKPKDKINLESVNLKSDKDNSIFAIMLEQDDGTYKEDNSNIWPTSGYAYNKDMSGCIDGNGNEIENSLSYNTDTKNVSIRTKEASYCYLYFSKPADNLYKLCKNYNNIDECIKTEINNIELVNGIWNSTLEDDGYRYVGTNPNNYICFGTTDKSTCTGNTDLYMYRIIGIFEDSLGNQHLKLIKSETLSPSVSGSFFWAWNNSISADIDWDESTLYNGLNGSYFLENTTYSYMQEQTWLNKVFDWDYIAANTWEYNYDYIGTGGLQYARNTPRIIYLHEMNKESKTSETCYVGYDKTIVGCEIGEWKEINAKIGLMYASDYVLALGNDIINTEVESNNDMFRTGWIHFKNNNLHTDYEYEWIMTRGGQHSDNYAYNIHNMGSLFSYWVMDHYGTYVVRPVFYLTSDIKITGGTGTIENPYIIG